MTATALTKTNVVLLELLRWALIITPLYLSAWQWAEVGGYPAYVNETMAGLSESGTFLAVTGLGLLLATLAVYLPVKVVILRYRWKRQIFRDNRWRPSIVAYIFLSALPSMTMICLALESPEGQGRATIDGVTITVLQIIVLCLVFTEWIAKKREEYFSYDLVTAMALDFFFAYDIIAFIMMVTYDSELYHSPWLYVGFVFAFISMFKYTPNCPPDLSKRGAAKGHIVSLLASLLLNDIPFIIVRVATMVLYGAMISDIIYPLKNFAMIVFSIMQITMIRINLKALKKTGELKIIINRKAKFPGAWGDDAEVTPMGSDTSMTPSAESGKTELAGETQTTATNGQTTSGKNAPSSTEQQGSNQQSKNSKESPVNLAMA